MVFSSRLRSGPGGSSRWRIGFGEDELDFVVSEGVLHFAQGFDGVFCGGGAQAGLLGGALEAACGLGLCFRDEVFVFPEGAVVAAFDVEAYGGRVESDGWQGNAQADASVGLRDAGDVFRCDLRQVDACFDGAFGDDEGSIAGGPPDDLFCSGDAGEPSFGFLCGFEAEDVFHVVGGGVEVAELLYGEQDGSCVDPVVAPVWREEQAQTSGEQDGEQGCAGEQGTSGAEGAARGARLSGDGRSGRMRDVFPQKGPE